MAEVGEAGPEVGVAEVGVAVVVVWLASQSPSNEMSLLKGRGLGIEPQIILKANQLPLY